MSQTSSRRVSRKTKSLCTCQQCSGPFYAYRKDAKFCSDACRQAAHRARRVGVGMAYTEMPSSYRWAGVVMENAAEGSIQMLDDLAKASGELAARKAIDIVHHVLAHVLTVADYEIYQDTLQKHGGKELEQLTIPF